MLKGFEEHTTDLTDYELKVLVPAFLDGFKSKIGVQRAITNKQIVERMKDKYHVNDVVVRKIISHIREEGLMPGLVASSKGYYLTDDPKDIERYIESLDGRETKIRQVKKAMQVYLKQLLTTDQLKINFNEKN